VVVLALALVFGIARLLGGNGSTGNQPSAQPAAADASTSSAPTSSAAPTSPSVVATAATVDSSPSATASGTAGAAAKKTAAATPLPVSSGPCRSDDIVATPTIKDTAYAGKPVVFAMDLTTKSTEACDFDVSAGSLVVKITSGSDRVWSTQDCRGAVPRQSVVVRKDTPATVDVAWSGQRSDTDCTRSTTWAEPGYYHAVAAAYGSAPVDKQFKLLKPVRPTVTASPTPRTTKTKTKATTTATATATTTTPSKTTTPSPKPHR
jgi:hypothetical protein